MWWVHQTTVQTWPLLLRRGGFELTDWFCADPPTGSANCDGGVKKGKQWRRKYFIQFYLQTFLVGENMSLFTVFGDFPLRYIIYLGYSGEVRIPEVHITWGINFLSEDTQTDNLWEPRWWRNFGPLKTKKESKERDFSHIVHISDRHLLFFDWIQPRCIDPSAFLRRIQTRGGGVSSPANAFFQPLEPPIKCPKNFPAFSPTKGKISSFTFMKFC